MTRWRPMMGTVAGLRCVSCGRVYREREVDYTCPVCGLDGTLDVLYNLDSIREVFTREALALNREYSLWRYWPILPVRNRENVQPVAVGWTPLYRANRIAAKYGVMSVYVKDDGRNPTASLKDRASAVGVAKALEYGRTVVACSSTGNAASSLAGLAAVAGLDCFIFVPRTVPDAKITQLLIYGAHVVLVDGTYHDAFELSMRAIERFGWYNRNCAINPYLVEGKKTCGLEIAEQLQWEVPDWVFIAVGDGCCISGLHKAFEDLKALGLIERVPKLCGVQAEGCQPIYRAFRDGAHRVQFGDAATLADSIAVGAPRNWAKALRAVRESGGRMVTVSDQDILDSMRELAREVGVFGEPAGAAGFAGFRKVAGEGALRATDRVAVVVTGNGLKDVAAARRACGEAITIRPDIDEFVRKMNEGGRVQR
ncbi:MAG: threonine synthase [Bacillota bacterium]